MIIEMLRLVELRLQMEALSILMVSDRLMMYLDCSAMAALMKSSLHSMLFSVVELSVKSLLAIFIKTFLVSLCRIRKPAALIVEAVISDVLLLRDKAKRMLARVVAENLSLIVMRALCSRRWWLNPHL